MTSNSHTDCLLISPAYLYDKGNIYKYVRASDPPLNLITLAAYIRDKGFSTKVIDCSINYPDIQMLYQHFITLQNHPPKYIGIGIYTSQAKICYEIAKRIKNILPDTILIAGGPHATFSFEEILESNTFNIIVLGEGELPLTEILQGKELNQIKGIVYKDDYNTIIKTEAQKRIKDLDSLPLPAYDLLELSKYRPTIGSFKNLPSLILTTSRGCPGNCSFCTKTLGREHYQKTAHKIFQELKILVEKFNIRDFAFHDDTFTSIKKNIIDLCELIIKNNLKISWLCYSRIDTIDAELLKFMKKAGCHQIMYGVESFDQNVLNSIHKGINTKKVEKISKLTQKIGITSKLTFIIGNPTDTMQTLKLTIKKTLQINPDLIVVNIATPFPGTKMYNEENSKNNILTTNWAQYTGATVILKIEGLSEQQILSCYKRFYLKFYFRPTQILRIAKRISYYGGFTNIVSGAFSVIKMLLKR